MIIKYKNKVLRHNLIFGLIWIIIGIGYQFTDNSNWVGYGFIVLGLIYLISYAYQKHYHYLKLTESSITKNGLFSKTLLFSDINRVKYIAGEYSLLTSKKKLTINKELVDPSSLEELETIIERLKL